jgi:hypothetical protein
MGEWDDLRRCSLMSRLRPASGQLDAPHPWSISRRKWNETFEGFALACARFWSKTENGFSALISTTCDSKSEKLKKNASGGSSWSSIGMPIRLRKD